MCSIPVIVLFFQCEYLGCTQIFTIQILGRFLRGQDEYLKQALLLLDYLRRHLL